MAFFDDKLTIDMSLQTVKNNVGKRSSSVASRESRPSFRKRSDPTIPRSKSDVDVEAEDKTNRTLNNSGSSSNSSLSNRSLDSPCNSLEMVHRTPSGSPADFLPTGSGSVSGVQPVCSNTSTVQHYDDSDLEADVDPPNWQANLDWETIRLLKPKERKRQDVINELFHTEKTHVKNLKILERIFYKPLLNELLLPPEFLHLLFPNLEEMLNIHSEFNNKMKQKRKKEEIIGNIGEMMLEMFDGIAGENLKQAAATFCRNQSIALESLKIKQKREQKLAQFIMDAECNHLCRRLQLKDIVATGFQRLTKYPLLLENIAKYTVLNTEEHRNLLKALECSRHILAYVNQAVKEAENQHRLKCIHKKLDRTAFDKADNPIAQNYKNLDLTRHLLLYEGTLTWRLNKQKSIEIQVVLLEDILVLLQKQDDKYILKFHNTNLLSGREDTKVAHSPILRLHNLFTRDVATDKRAFFLVTTEQHAIYEFAASSASERKIWLKHLTGAIDSCKASADHKKFQENLLPQSDKQENSDIVLDAETNANAEFSSHLEMVPEKDANGNEHKETENTDAKLPEEQTTISTDAKDETPNTDSISSDNSEPKKQRRLQRVEILKIADGPELIAPSEVIVSQGAVYQTAEPVLTPVEQLRRKEQQITRALNEKETLVAEILHITPEDIEHVAEIVNEKDGKKDVQDLLLASIYQSNQLSLLVNRALQVTEEDTISASSAEVSPEGVSSPGISQSRSRRKLGLHSTCPEKLLSISLALNKYLTKLLSMVTEHEEERVQLRTELHNSREQIHSLLEAHRACTLHLSSPNNLSRQSNFFSITSECCCESITTTQLYSDHENQHMSNELNTTHQTAKETVVEQESMPCETPDLMESFPNHNTSNAHS